MMKLTALPLLALAAACGQGDPANQAAAVNANASPVANAADAASPAQVAVDSKAVPRPSDVKTFRDWSVACDNGRSCEATSLAPGEGNLQDIGLLVRRPAGAEGQVSVTLRSPSDQAGAVELLADGKRLAGGTWDAKGVALFDTGASAQIAGAIVNARALTVRGAGAQLATISPAGTSAALRYMDEQQGRAGTATALVAKGSQPFTATAPALPTVVAAPIARGEAAKPSAALIAEMRRTSDCPADEFGPVSEEAIKLSDRDTLVLISCGSGAYNAMSAPFIVTDGKARPAASDHSYEVDPDKTGFRLVNASWDAATGRLSSYFKARGLGDCGDASVWVWDATRFRLIEAETEGNCRGAIKLLRTWIARVERAR